MQKNNKLKKEGVLLNEVSAKYIKQYMKDNNLKLKDIAVITGYSISYLSILLNHPRQTPYDKIMGELKIGIEPSNNNFSFK